VLDVLAAELVSVGVEVEELSFGAGRVLLGGGAKFDGMCVLTDAPAVAASDEPLCVDT
jgi:hypothetical protein